MEGAIGVLIVEDDLLQSKIIQRVVESLNHTVLGAVTSGEEAIKMAAELNPDVIFMDIVLEGEMSGIETAKRINDKSNAAIIYITGYPWTKIKNELNSTCFDKILTKPVSISDIEAAIMKYK